jgi:hypothetical protein
MGVCAVGCPGSSRTETQRWQGGQSHELPLCWCPMNKVRAKMAAQATNLRLNQSFQRAS